jgi:preprotein translocase subunit SecD
MKCLHLCFALLLVLVPLASACSAPTYSTKVTFEPDTTRAVLPGDLLLAKNVLQKRLHAGLKGKSLVQVEQNALRVGLSNQEDLPTAITLATQAGLLTFFHSDAFMEIGLPVPANPTVIMTGADIAQAKALRDPNYDQWEVEIRLNPQSKARLASYTSSHVGAFLVIAQDNRVISSPRVNAAITGGSAVIQGIFDQTSAELLAAVLNSGALPVPLRVKK